MIADLVRERGPMTVAAFIDLALYHPQLGYYARAAQRSGRAGDFFTSVDVGPAFGELLEIQIAEMAALLAASSASSAPSTSSAPIDLVEAGAGNGRLAGDVLRAMQRRHPDLYDRLHLTLVDASPAARAAQAATLQGIFDRPFVSSDSLPATIEGVVFANELLDALPVHQVIVRDEGLREVYVTADAEGFGMTTREGPLSTPALRDYLDRLDVHLESGWRIEINLRAIEWIRNVAARLRRGFVILIDYGHEAPQLYSSTHAGGTLTTFARHTAETDTRLTPSWLRNPGGQDITAHVDFTSVRAAAEAEGLTTIGFLDQTYFILGLMPHLDHPTQPGHPVNRLHLQLKTLLMPGGLGSTMKVLLLAKGVGRPSLHGCSYRVRAT